MKARPVSNPWFRAEVDPYLVLVPFGSTVIDTVNGPVNVTLNKGDSLSSPDVCIVDLGFDVGFVLLADKPLKATGLTAACRHNEILWDKLPKGSGNTISPLPALAVALASGFVLGGKTRRKED